MAAKTEAQQHDETLDYVGRIFTYVLHKRGVPSVQVSYGSAAIDSTYNKGGPRSARSLLAYLFDLAFEEAAKQPEFCEKFGTNPEDFFVTVEQQFIV